MEKLYQQDPFLTRFTAQVVSCAADKGGWSVVLDRTAFYPEGGGQPWDTGTLNGIPVTQVQEQDGAVVHTCAARLEPGTQVEGAVDWARRFDLMQQHSGEHIVSGLIHSTYGYDNVGFHLGSDLVTIDFNGPLEEEDLRDIELRANQYIWESDWRTIGLLKFCLLSLGICVGMAVPEEKKKTVLRAAFLSFVISYIPLMAKFIRIIWSDEGDW
mgnify:FL=1